MEDNNQLSFPEEDEDLEALRLAALQSLKRKGGNEGLVSPKEKPPFNGSPRGKQKWGKFSRSFPRNGQFNGWTPRNSNLIAVPMVPEAEKDPKKPEVPKLVLPQDRYCKQEDSPVKSDAPSKFDRYNNSDSDSDSEEENCKSGGEAELKRSNSLEALMAELENEIQGVSSKPEDKPKPKLKKKRKISTPTTESEVKPVPVLKENLKPEPELPKKPFQNNFKQRKWHPKPRPSRQVPSFTPPNVVHHPVDVMPPVVAFVPPPVPNFPYNPFDSGVYVPPPVFEAPPPQLPPMHVAPPIYERPLSPLVLNTDAYSTNTLAPLSPRSAAFVMENRAIIEKRKRRSYSRSPSPARFRRSKTPKRSLSPKRLSKSPKRRSLSPSPVRKVLPPRNNSPKKAPIHDRLGLKAAKTEEDDKSEKKVDPVLEARRKKFERHEITMTEGVIRLKKQEEDSKEQRENEERTQQSQDLPQQEEEELDEDTLLEGDDPDDSLVLDHKIDALFSDEESDSDNEGRFKTKQESNQKVPVLPFRKLINGTNSDVTKNLKVEERKSERARSDRRQRYRSRSPPKKRTVKKSEKVKPISLGNDRKIEIKIRNPAKYEKTDAGEEKEKEKGRKVEVAKECCEKDNEVADDTKEDATNSIISEGDLRTQLSRKRAERQKHPLPDVVPSRLLQSALQGVGFHKSKKSKSKDESTEGKLPIHLRLGAANSSEPFGKKPRKHKNKGSQEQV